MSDKKQIRPSWWYSLLAIPCLFLGIGLFLVLLSRGIRQTVGTVTQVTVPGQVVLNITTTGTYTIFLEQPSIVNGKIYSDAGTVSDLTCQLTQQLPSQTPVDSPRTEVALRQPPFNLTYSLDNRSGRSVLEFEAGRVALY